MGVHQNAIRSHACGFKQAAQLFAVGILPYHARLTTIDMHGLTDATVARQGKTVSNRPGHKRFATEAYLKQRRVNLVIGHPKITPAAALDDLPADLLGSCLQAAEPTTEDAMIIAIPITERHVLLAWYLTPHPALDRAIEVFEWHTFVIRNPSLEGRGEKNPPLTLQR